MPLLSPGEIAREPVTLAPGQSYTNPPDAGDGAVVFPSGFTLADLVRYAVACSDYDEVRTLVVLMDPGT